MIQKMKRNWMKLRGYLLRNKIMLTLFCFLGAVIFLIIWDGCIELCLMWIQSCI